MSQTIQRIAFICFSQSLGGLELSAVRLAAAMRQRGIGAWMVSPANSSLTLRAQEARISLIPMSPRWKYGDIMTARRLASVLKEHQIDAVIVMRSSDIHLAALASLLRRKTKFVFLQQMQSGLNKRGLLRTIMYSRLSLWVTLTARMKKDVEQLTRFPAEKVIVNPVGVELAKFDPSRISQREAREHFGLPEQGLLVGVLGRLDPQKGQEILLHAAPEIRKRAPETLFVIAGDETEGERGYKAHLENLARSLGIENAVTFLPFTENVPEFMAAIDLFVLPSFSETFGFVLIEAMAMEKPVIATNAGGVPEIIVDGKTGLLVEPRDLSSLALAVFRIIENRTLDLSLGRTARAEVLQKYDIGMCAGKLLEAINTL